MSDNTDGFRGHSGISEENNDGYALSGKIMLSTIVLLFFVVILAFILHLYARWYLLRARRRRSNERRNRRRAQLVFYVEPHANAAAVVRGLDARVLKSLPVFTFSPETQPDSALECAVCLSEFEENEPGRTLPKCNHSFHLECIDMWFHSHSTCPLCRTPVEESVPVSQNPGDSVLTVNEATGEESRSDSCSTCQHEEGHEGAPVVGSRRKLSIEVPRGNGEGFEGGESSGCNSGPSQPHKSPMMSRMLSFKRMLSRDRRGSGGGSMTVSELDIERGGGEETRETTHS